MFCSNCGTQIPDEANFCWKCGKPQGPGNQADEPKWETCEIFYQKVYEGLTGTRGHFYTESIGPEGVKRFARTEEFGCGYNCWEPDKGNQKTVQILKNLIALLVKNGWESTGDRGENWWNTRFKRKIQVDKEGVKHYDVILTVAGKQKIEIIKVIRQLIGVELKDAKTLAETPEALILYQVGKDEAEYAKYALEQVGGTVNIR